MTSHCLHCHKQISGRSDKKFCSAECRNVVNSENRRIARQPTIAINDILWKNREVLRKLWPGRPILITRDHLINHGFQLQYHTQLHLATNRIPYYVCYDFGFQPTFKANVPMALIVKMISPSTPDPWDIVKMTI